MTSLEEDGSIKLGGIPIKSFPEMFSFLVRPGSSSTVFIVLWNPGITAGTSFHWLPDLGTNATDLCPPSAAGTVVLPATHQLVAVHQYMVKTRTAEGGSLPLETSSSI